MSESRRNIQRVPVRSPIPVAACLCGALIVSIAARADLIDPMRPAGPGNGPAHSAAPIRPRVTAVFLSGQRRVAVFDGRVVKVGDRVGDVTIEEISADGVRYMRAGKVEYARLPQQATPVRRNAAGAEEGQ
jgi:MSHA biogenesis protein MshK